jgi:hypothetical protein
VGVARSTLYRAIKDGRLTRDPDGTIDTSKEAKEFLEEVNHSFNKV